jgi:hypothetical protein
MLLRVNDGITLGDHCMASQTMYANHCLLVRSIHKRAKYKKEQKLKNKQNTSHVYLPKRSTAGNIII